MSNIYVVQKYMGMNNICSTEMYLYVNLKLDLQIVRKDGNYRLINTIEIPCLACLYSVVML